MEYHSGPKKENRIHLKYLEQREFNVGHACIGDEELRMQTVGSEATLR